MKIVSYAPIVCNALLLASGSTILNAWSLKEVTSWFSSYPEKNLSQELECQPNHVVVVKNQWGPITVKSWKQPKVVIETTVNAKEADLPAFDLSTHMHGNKIMIQPIYHTDDESIDSSKIKAQININLMVPEHAHLKAIAPHDSVKIKNVTGKLYIKSSGTIEVLEAENSIQIVGGNKPITVSHTKIPETGSISIQSLNGPITYSLPEQTNAAISAQTLTGTIVSHKEVLLKPYATKLNQQAWKQFKKQMNGTFGTGTAHIQIASKNGNIKVLEL